MPIRTPFYIFPSRQPERKQRPPRFLPFKVGDRIVICPHKTACSGRGRTGTINRLLNHLEVEAVLDAGVSPFKQTEKAEVVYSKTYMLRQASECSDCCNRMTHMMGAYCPNGQKDIVFYEKEEASEGEGEVRCQDIDTDGSTPNEAGQVDNPS